MVLQQTPPKIKFKEQHEPKTSQSDSREYSYRPTVLPGWEIALALLGIRTLH